MASTSHELSVRVCTGVYLGTLPDLDWTILHMLNVSKVKHYYELTVDSAEKEALSDVLNNVC